MTLASPTEPPVAAVASRPRGRPRKTIEERDDGNRRQALLATAARLFRQQGFDATSTRDIAAAAGMRSGSPFYHFENKQALLAAVMREGMRSALERQKRAIAALPAQATPRERLSVLVRNHFEVLLGPNSDFIPVMLYEWRRLAPEQVGEITALKDAFEADWVPVLTALHASGQLAGDPVLARLMIFGALNWSVQWYRPPLSPSPHAPHELRAGRNQRRATLDDLTTTALQLFLKACS